MKGNQSLLRKKFTSNNMTCKPLSIPCSPRSNSRENRDSSRHRSPNRTSNSNSKPYYRNSNFKLLSRTAHCIPDRKIFKILSQFITTTTTQITLKNNHLFTIELEIGQEYISREIAFKMCKSRLTRF